MKKLLVILSALSFMVSCEQIDGNLQVLENISLKARKGFKSISAGEYKAEIKLKSKRKLRLEVNGNKFTFKIPRKVKIPTNNGTIKLTSSQVKQPYGINGSVQTEVERTATRYDWEQCSYQVPHTVCTVDGRGRQQCHTQYNTFYGRRDVRYHTRIEDKTLEIDLITEGGKVMASFTGEETYRHRINEYTGVCR